MLVFAAVASASATFDPSTGKGFVGKGDVQTVFNLNNGALQNALIANAQAFTFKTSQSASQAVSQEAEQDGEQDGTEYATQVGEQAVTESATETAHWVLSCTITKDTGKKTIVAYN